MSLNSVTITGLIDFVNFRLIIYEKEGKGWVERCV